MKNDKFVGVFEDGKLVYHAVAESGNYPTLCGIDGGMDGDTTLGWGGVKFPLNDSATIKIDCPQCQAIIRHAWKYKKTDLAEKES